MANQALFTPNRALDANAYALPGATATFYATGTTTLISVYSDENGLVATANPVVADGNGIFAQTFFDGEAKVVVRDAGGATLWTVDPCPSTSGAATGAASIPFNPTVTVPSTNVQAAIELVSASAIAGAADFGLGITGNAPTIANIDNTAQASGVYRFTAASTGTFPSGITAATTGLVVLDRQTSAEAVMYLRAAGGSKLYIRHLAASAWGAWVVLSSASAAHTVWLPAGAFTPTVTNGAAYASQELATNDVMVSGFDFSASVDQKIQTMIAMPKSWNESTVTAEILWKDATTAGTGDVIWGVRALAVSNDDAMDAAFGTAQTVTDTFITAGDLHITSATAAITAAGTPAEGDMLIVEVYRDADAGGDTYTQLARFIGVRLLYSTNAADDS